MAVKKQGKSSAGKRTAPMAAKRNLDSKRAILREKSSFMVHHGNTKNRELLEALRQLRMAGARVLGFIYNDAPVEGKRYYYSYYNRGKGR